LTDSVARTVGTAQRDSGSAVRQAVHLNSTGIDGDYRGRSSRRQGVASRLRAVRQAEIVPAGEVVPRKPQALGDIGLPEAITVDALPGESVPGDAPPQQPVPAVGADDGPTPMPSIMKKPAPQLASAPAGDSEANSDAAPPAETVPGPNRAAPANAPSAQPVSSVPRQVPRPAASPAVTVEENPTNSDHVPHPALEIASVDPIDSARPEPGETGAQTTSEDTGGGELPDLLDEALPAAPAVGASTSILMPPTDPVAEDDPPPVAEGVTIAGSVDQEPAPRPVEDAPLADDAPAIEQVEAFQIGSGGEATGQPSGHGFSFSEPPATKSNDAQDDSILLANRSPVLSVSTRGPRTIKVGVSATYEVHVVNSSENVAHDVAVRVVVPSWAEVTRTDASAGGVRVEADEQGNAVVSWTIPQLAGRAREATRLDIVPRSSRPFELGVSWTFAPATTLAQIEVQEPKLQMSIVGPQDVLFGETKVYTITVSNPGTGDAENVTLSLLPISDGDGPVGSRSLGTIQAGMRRTVEVELAARQAGRLMVRAQATADGGLHCRSQQDVLVRRAKLEVEASGPSTKYAGTAAHYSIRVANTGDATAVAVIAAAALPPQARFEASSDGGVYDADQGQVRWSVGALRPGAVRVLEMSCILLGAGVNRMEFQARSGDQLTAAHLVDTEVESLADLKLTVNDPPGAVAVGTEVTYEVRIVNRGTKAARNIGVVGYFSEGIEPVGVHGWRAQLEVGQVEMEQISRLGPGQEMTLKVLAQAHRAGDHVFRAELQSEDPETKLAVEEWTRFYGDDVPPVRQASAQLPSPRVLPGGQPEVRR
jgi:hypothetical protein